MKKIYSLALATLLSAVSVSAQTVTIGETSYGSIGAAITSAIDGDVIDITGIHTESITWTDKSITLRGTDPSTDIIQAAAAAGTASSRVITIDEPTTPIIVTIENLTIRYGNSSANGGGISVDKNNGLVTLKNLVIEDNATSNNGGGISVAGSNVDMVGVTIRNNTATLDGGGLLLAPNNGSGADSEINISQSLIDENTGRNGGGIYINGNADFGNDYRINIEITNTTIANNATTSGSGAAGGGGIWSKGATWTTNAGGDGTTGNITLKMVHATMFGNAHAALTKAGIQFTGTATIFSIYNSIVVSGDDVAIKALNFANSNTTEVINCILGGLNAVPAIVDAEGTNNQKGKTATEAGIASTLSDEGGSVQVLSLTAGSAAIDYCTATVPVEITLPTVDARGETRNTTPDAGAYEALTILSVASMLSPSVDAVYDNISIASAGHLTIPSGTTLTVNNHIQNEGMLTIESGGSIVMLGTYGGNDATVKRKVTGNSGYSIVGVPVNGADISTLNADYLYTWDGTSWTEPTGEMFAGTGYFAGYDVANPEISVSGPLWTGNKFVSVAPAGDNFKLVANPFPSAISIASFRASTANMNNTTGAVYLWDDGGSNVGNNRGGDYIEVNELGTTTVGLSDNVAGGQGEASANMGYIGSMQGFFVEVTNTGLVGLGKAMQTSTAGANADANYYRKANDDKQVVKLKLAGNGFANSIIIGLVDGATFGQDYGLDATKYSSNEDFSFYSKLDGRKMAIQGLPQISYKEIAVDLGMNLSKSGYYTLSVDGFEGFSSDLEVILLDLEEDKAYTVDETFSVVISADAASSLTERFRLVFKSASILSASVFEAKMKVYGSEDGLTISYAIDAEQVVTIHSLDGKTIFKEKTSFNNNEAKINPSLLKGQVYILRVQDAAVKFIIK
ncbi:MAG: hypothetical protein ACJA08_002989 [Cyclobacteriaceae bacterium]|jgi:hypothetical protein